MWWCNSASSTTGARCRRSGMNRPVNAQWRPASKAVTWGRRCLLGGALAMLGVVTSQWLAGYFFLWSLHRPTHLASPLTVARYAVYYGPVPGVRRKLWICSGVGLGLVASAALVFAWPKGR